MCGGVMEKDLTLDIARRVDRLLDSEGVATLMTRLGDSYVSLADRAAFGNRANGSIFISIHFNEDDKPVASGVETYYAAHQINSGSSFAAWLPFFSRSPSNSPNPKAKASPVSFRKRWWRGPAPSIADASKTIFCDRKRDFTCGVD